MARSVDGPWFRGSKNTWYVTHEGRNVSLRVQGKSNRGEAVKAWHRLLIDGIVETPEGKPNATPKMDTTITGIVNVFLSAKKGTIKDGTHDVYGWLLKSVTEAFGLLPPSKLTSDVFGKWLHSLTLSSSSKNGIAGVTMTVFKWAVAEGIISNDPLKGFKKPRKVSRGATAIINEDTHERLFNVASAYLQPLLTLESLHNSLYCR